MKDPEFIALRNRFLIALIVTLIFVIPMSIFIFNKFSTTKSEALKNIDQEKSIIIYLTKNKCSKCEKYKKVLDNNNVNYFELNIDKDEDFKEIMLKIEMSSKYATAPGVIYVEKGKMYANIVDIKGAEELNIFLEKHNLKNTNTGSE